MRMWLHVSHLPLQGSFEVCNETAREEKILDLESNPEHQLLTAQAFQVPLLLKQRY